MTIVLNFLLSFGVLAVLAGLHFVVLATMSPYGKLWEHPEDCDRITKSLRTSKRAQDFRKRVAFCLNWLDNRLSKDELDRNLGYKRIAFSHDLISYAMLAAVAYPILSLLIQWICGSPLQLGSEQIAPAGTTIPEFLLFCGLVLHYFFSFVLLTPNPDGAAHCLLAPSGFGWAVNSWQFG